MHDYPTHPAADLFPMLGDRAFAELVDDIRANGLAQPITLCDGQILDGRNRYRACREAGVEPRFTEYTGDSPVAFVWSANGVRRQLSKSQLSAIAAKMLPVLHEEARRRKANSTSFGAADRDVQHVADAGDCGRARDKAGEIVGVSGENVRRAAVVMDRDPALFAQVERGEVTVHDAHHRVTKPDAPPIAPTKKPRAARVAEIAALAAQGHRAEQIADQIGVSAQQVRNIANAEGVDLPDKAFGKSRRIDPRRVIEETVHALAGISSGISAINGSVIEIGPEEAGRWAAAIGGAVRSLNQLRKQLSEVARNGS